MSIKHLPELDGLRGVAVLIVLTYHAFAFIKIPGQYGVTLFFFISGFIITRMMLAQDFAFGDFKAFYLRRLFRLAPALLVFLLSAWLVFNILGAPIPLTDFRATLLYYANYHTYLPVSGQPSSLELNWSLAVEEHFYFVFPMLFVLTPRKHLVVCLLILAVFILAWRTVAAMLLGIPEIDIARHTDTRLDSIVWGCLLSALIESRHRVLGYLGSHQFLAGALVITGTDFLIHSFAYRNSVHYSIQGIALMVFFCSVFWSQTAPAWLTKVLSSRVMTFFGRISYSLYLYNVMALVCGRILFDNIVVSTTFGLVGATVAAFLSYRWVERPFRIYGSQIAAAGRART